jgi:hypothetical protein
MDKPAQSSTDAQGAQDLIQSAAKDLLPELVETFRRLGKQQLADSLAAVSDFAPSAAQWTVERQAAVAAGDAARAAQIDRNFGLLAADAALRLGDAGVQGQAATEHTVQSVLELAGKFVAVAAVAAL